MKKKSWLCSVKLEILIITFKKGKKDNWRWQYIYRVRKTQLNSKSKVELSSLMIIKPMTKTALYFLANKSKSGLHKRQYTCICFINKQGLDINLRSDNYKSRLNQNFVMQWHSLRPHTCAVYTYFALVPATCWWFASSRQCLFPPILLKHCSATPSPSHAL